MNRIFLSYARDDDEPFVKRLHADLTQAGFAVWFDRASLRSRGLTFHQEIKDAIRTEIDRVIYIGGPKAAKSAYVREEWQFALACDHVVVTPILRLGDYDNIPGELSLLHCEDFRDDVKYPSVLANLVENLRQPNPKLGGLFAVPSLSPHFLGRPELMRRVRDALLIDLQRPQVIAGADARIGMQGMGGIGKSVLAAALARTRQVRQAYPDGVVWIAAGQNLTDDELLRRQRDLVRHLGGDDRFSSLAQGQGVLRGLLAAKAVLLILDDVWQASDAQVFDVLGPRCRMLVTTRDAGILRTLNGQLVPVSLFTESEALQLLSSAVGVERAALPRAAQNVVKECGCLPLALALAGGMAKAGHSWHNIVEALREADLEWAENREGANEQHRTIWSAMKASYDALPEKEKARFAELAVFGTDRTVPEAAAQVLWHHTAQLSDRHCSKVLINLAERSIIQLDQNSVQSSESIERRFRLHDLVYDFATRIAGDPESLHRTLLDAYRQKCPNGWPSGPDDGYFLQNLCYHLIHAGVIDDAVNLLSDLPWIEARCRAGQVFEMIDDYHVLLETWPESRKDVAREKANIEECARYGAQMVDYARTWSTLRDQQSTVGAARLPPACTPAPQLPTPPAICRMWTDEEIEAECQRIRASPTRLDCLRAFAGFVESQCYPLVEFGKRPVFVAQQAFNFGPAGPVHNSGTQLLTAESPPCVLRRWAGDAKPNLKPACIQTLKGHSRGVTNVSVTPDCRRAVTGSLDATIRVWDLESGACLWTLNGHSSTVSSVSVTPDGRRAVSGSADKTLRVWDLESGVCLRTLEGHSDEVKSVSATPDGRCAVSGSGDKTVRVWDLESGACIQTLKGHSDGVNSVSVAPNGRRVVTEGVDKTVRVWDLESGACLWTQENHCASVCSMSVTPDGRRAVTGSRDATLQVWDLESGAILRTLEGHSGGIPGVRVTPDGRRAVSGSDDDTLRVWDLESGAILRTLEGHGGGISSVSVTPDGRHAVTGSWDATVQVWDLASGSCPRALEDFTGRVECVTVTPDGRGAVTGAWDATRVWDLENGVCQRKLKGHIYGVHCINVAPDGRHVVSGHSDNTICVWDLESSECPGMWLTASGRLPLSSRVRRMGGHAVWVNSVSVAPDGRRAVSGSRDKTLRVWDMESGACLWTLKGHIGGVNSVSVTLDGQRVVSGSDDATLRVWDLESGACLWTLKGHSGGVNSVSVMPDGRRAISGSSDKTLRVWDLESGVCLRTLEGHSEGISCVSVTPDGRCAVTGSWDSTLRVWDLESGACLAVFLPNALVCAVGLSSGKLVVGLYTGEVVFAEMRNVPLWPPIPAPVHTYATDSAYEHILCHGLEISRNEKGNDHEVVFAHLTALVAHLEKMKKTDKAREFALERDSLEAKNRGRMNHGV